MPHVKDPQSSQSRHDSHFSDVHERMKPCVQYKVSDTRRRL